MSVSVFWGWGEDVVMEWGSQGLEKVGDMGWGCKRILSSFSISSPCDNRHQLHIVLAECPATYTDWGISAKLCIKNNQDQCQTVFKTEFFTSCAK